MRGEGQAGAPAGGAPPKVSVCVITYNHAPYIRACLESVLAQEADFPFEVVVGDDASTDGTRAILAELEAAHPERIRLILQERNTGGAGNYRDVHAAARGEYVAHLDGDDLALPGKLQALAEALDLDPDAAVAGHPVAILGTDKVLGADRRYPDRGGLDDLVRLGNYLVHSGTMYRRRCYPAHTDTRLSYDYRIHLDLAGRGAVVLVRRVLGSYRVQAGGLSRDLRNLERMEDLKLRALDHALALGAAPDLVRRARLETRLYYAVRRYLGGDRSGYRRGVRLAPGEFRHASWQHRILHATRFCPGLLGAFLRLRRLLLGPDPRRLG